VNIVAIGISTGGPRTLRAVLDGLEALDACLLVVQHMPKFVNAPYQESMQSICEMDLRIAEQDDKLAHGTVFVAPSEVHMTLRDNRSIHLFGDDKVQSVCPSVDVLLTSIQASDDRVIGIVMTGMGEDGVLGLRHIKNIGGHTIAQDPTSCIIDGMPEAAIATGCVDDVLTYMGIRQMLAESFGQVCV